MALSASLRYEMRKDKVCADQERARRVEYRKRRQEMFARRKELRDEMRCVREFAELVRMDWANDENAAGPVSAPMFGDGLEF